MPTYVVRTANLTLDAERAGALARAVTAAHAGATGAPGYLAQVILEAVPPGGHFIGGCPNIHPHVFVHGLVRAGRTAAQKGALLEELRERIAEAASVGREDVWITLQDVAAEQMMEFGRVLPAPGGEAGWRRAFSAEKLATLRGAGVAVP